MTSHGEPAVGLGRIPPDVRRCAWALPCLTFLLGSLTAGEPLIVRLRDTVLVAADRARLDDVAELDGPTDVVATAAPVLVQALDDLAERLLSAQTVTAALRRALPEVKVLVRGECRVSRASHAYTEADLVAAVEAHLKSRLGTAEWQTALLRASGALVVPADRTADAVLVAEPITERLWGEVAYRVRALRGERELARGLVVLRLQVFSTVPVAARNLRRDQVLGQEDIVAQRQELGTATGSSPPELAALVGRMCALDLPAGSPLSLLNTRPAPLVRGGGSVSIVYHGDHFTLSVGGVALGDGALGDLIRVRQPGGQLIRARVTGPGAAEIAQE